MVLAFRKRQSGARRVASWLAVCLALAGPLSALAAAPNPKAAAAPRRVEAPQPALAPRPAAPSTMAELEQILSFEDRVKAQEAIERVYYAKRIWPKENPGPKPPFEVLMPRAAIEAKVRAQMQRAVDHAQQRGRGLSDAELDAELARMQRDSRDPATLSALRSVLLEDPRGLREMLARPAIVGRFMMQRPRLDESMLLPTSTTPSGSPGHGFRLPSGVPPVPDSKIATVPPLPVPATMTETWTRMGGALPVAASGHTAVWTGSEVIVWGGLGDPSQRYDPISDTWTEVSLTGAPPVREGHTAVWTGTEMIVWGGFDSGSNTDLDSGGRYNPSTDTWVDTPQGAGLPEARRYHTAVWTGTNMIVWGGKVGGVYSDIYLNTGGRYDAASNSWTPTSTGANVPTPRRAHSMIWTGSEMIVWGGYRYAGVTYYGYNTGGRYAPATDTWMPTSTGLNVPSARQDHTAVWTGSEMIVWGGNGDLNSGARYSPASDAWAPTSTGLNLPEGRKWHTAVWTGAHMVVWGGFKGGGAGSFLNSGGRYDPVGDSWVATTITGAPTGRYAHTALWTGTEMIIWGGTTNPNYLAVKTGGRYDPGSNSWVATGIGPSVPGARAQHTAIWTGAEMIVWGGTSATDTGGRYDPAMDTWFETAPADGSVGRFGHSAIWTGALMIIWGGSTAGLDKLDTGAGYDPAGDYWSGLPTDAGCPAGRDLHTAVWTGTEMIVWGGRGYDGYDFVHFDTGARYDPMSETWSPISVEPSTPSPRAGHTSVWTGSEMIVWGGDSDPYDNTSLNSGGRYNPISDSWVPTSSGPSLPEPRDGHTCVWTGSEMIVWGGFGIGSLNTGARYTPSTDSWVSTSTGAGVPEPRHAHTAVWTGREMIVWGGGSYWDTGGRYDPALDVWTPTTLTNAPIAREKHTSVWTGLEMMVWGGYNEFYTGKLDSGGRYSPACGTVPVLSAIFAVSDIQSCQDSGVSVAWDLPTDWGDVGVLGRRIEVMRDGVAIESGGCSGLAPNQTSCVDDSGINGNIYSYSVRFVSSCYQVATTSAVDAADDGGVPKLINEAAYDANDCTDSGVFLYWNTVWGSATASGRTVQVLRDGVALATGGCSNLPDTAYYCVDDTGVNGLPYQYQVRVTDSCGFSAETDPVPVADGSSTTPTLNGNNSALDVAVCADSGVSISWNLPLSWGDNRLWGRTIQVLRNGIVLASGGCANLPSTATSCVDNTGVNGATYTYAVRFTNGCSWWINSSGTTASDFVPANPQLNGTSSAWDAGPACADEGVSVLWGSPTSWGDAAPGGRQVEVLRAGSPLAGGGCSGLPTTATACVDETGMNETSYTYAVRFTNSCGLQSATAGSSAMDAVEPSPAVTGSGANSCPAAATTLAVGAFPGIQWKDGVQPIPGATGAAWNPVVSGSYAVQATNPSGCSATSAPVAVNITGCNGGCGANVLDEQAGALVGWTAEPDNDAGYGLTAVNGLLTPVFGGAPEPRWYVSSFSKPLSTSLAPGANAVFEVGMKSLNASASALGAIQVQWMDASGNVAAEIDWSADNCCVSNGYLWFLAEGSFVVAEAPGDTPVIHDVLQLRRAGSMWSAYRGGTLLGSLTIPPTTTPTKVKLTFWRPDGTYPVRDMAVDYITTGTQGVAAEVQGLQLVKGAGSTVTWTWTDVSGGTSYTVYEDSAANGTFSTATGVATSGATGLNAAMPPGDRFYRVRAQNGCGEGP